MNSSSSSPLRSQRSLKAAGKRQALRHMPEEVRASIKQWMPVPTVNCVLTRGGSAKSPREFMLVKRLIAPYQGQWFVADAWQGAMETTEQSLQYLVQKEFGLDTNAKGVIVRFVGNFDALYPKCKACGGQPPWHAAWRFYLGHISQAAVLKPNPEAGEAKWFTEIDHSWPAPVKKALLAAGFFEKQSW